MSNKDWKNNFIKFVNKLSKNRKENMKAKNYKSITEILEKKYKKKFYLFMDLQDCMNRIKQRKDQ